MGWGRKDAWRGSQHGGYHQKCTCRGSTHRGGNEPVLRAADEERSFHVQGRQGASLVHAEEKDRTG